MHPTDAATAPCSKERTTVPDGDKSSFRILTRHVVAVVTAIALIAACCFLWRYIPIPLGRADSLLGQARKYRSSHEPARAEELALRALKINDQLVEAGFLAADCAADQDAYDRAIAHLQRLKPTETRLQFRAAFAMARWNVQLNRLSDAERAYRSALVLIPDHVESNTELAKLLSLCGRMREAIPFILQLIRQGVETDLLILLSTDSGVLNDRNALTQARKSVPDDPNPLVGLAWHAANDGQTDEAIALLRHAIRLAPDMLIAHVALGQQLLAAQRDADLVIWSKSLPHAAEAIGESWFVRGALAENSKDLSGAIRCYGEGLRHSPDSRSATAHLAHLLAEHGDMALSQQFAKQLIQMQNLEKVQNRVLLSNDHSTIKPLMELSEAYEKVGRIWEAYGWCRFAVRMDDSDPEGRTLLQRLQDRVRDLPLKLVDDSANVALASNFSGYPFPRLETPVVRNETGSSVESSAIQFEDTAESTGLQFRYFNGTGPSSHHMFELTGGGIGVVDYDLDGFPDMYLTQGCPWPPGGSRSGDNDCLFRNEAGRRWSDVTQVAGIEESRFGQGVTVGDFNSDGFPDLYVANIGRNQLWANNGDGTFKVIDDQATGADDDWSTSCVMADLNGDGLADIYSVNYVTAPDVFERVCHEKDGTPKLCMPFDFFGQQDRLWLNDGNGHFSEVTSTALSTVPDGMGLGVAVWDAHGQGHLSLLVANDTTPNFLFVRESKNHEPFRMVERGIEAGLALTGDGRATGSMGIALGDVDGDGQLDVNITNFLGESNTLYLSSSQAGFFDDRTQAMGLARPTARVLGFGTQFLDANLDGKLEMFMTNGHIDDLRRHGKPYRMAPLYFLLQQDRFNEAPAARLGSYFEKEWLGRSVVRLDWNRDGRADLAVGHLFDHYALLTNVSRDVGHFVSIRLFGVQSNRDAIGTILKARAGQHTWTQQLTAGDGYHASNDRRIIFGIGSAPQIDELEIRWPSGLVQRFENVSPSREVLIPEGRRPY